MTSPTHSRAPNYTSNPRTSCLTQQPHTPIETQWTISSRAALKKKKLSRAASIVYNRLTRSLLLFVRMIELDDRLFPLPILLLIAFFSLGSSISIFFLGTSCLQALINRQDTREKKSSPTIKKKKQSLALTCERNRSSSTHRRALMLLIWQENPTAMFCVSIQDDEEKPASSSPREQRAKVGRVAARRRTATCGLEPAYTPGISRTRSARVSRRLPLSCARCAPPPPPPCM